MSSNTIVGLNADEALAALKEGNERFANSLTNPGDISPTVRAYGADHGQAPYAIIVACSDSRVIPEAAFCAGIGELFVIRVAGNVIDDHQLGSIEYASGHLGSKLVVVLGHTGCGAVDAAMNHDPSGYIKYITDDIRSAIGDERDEEAACRLNVLHSVSRIESSLEFAREETEDGLRVIGALYHIETGRVEFLS